MKLLALCLLIALFVLPVPSHAQGEAECEPDLSAVLTLIEEAQTALTDGEITATFDTLREVRRELARLESECLGLNMAGEGAWVSDIVVIPAGTYRVMMVAEDSDYTTVTLSPLEGECGKTFASDTPGLLVFGTEPQLQAVFVSEGCEALLDVQADGEWTIEWEKIR